MSFTPYTGKSSSTTITYAGNPLPKWKQITIQEDGKPQTGTLDTTDADSSAYEKITDPLGGKGNAKTTITVEGNMSKADYNDSGMTSLTLGGTGNIIVSKGSTGKDKFTLTSAKLIGLQVQHPYNEIVSYTLTFELNSTGTWATV